MIDFMLHNHRHSLSNSWPYFVLCTRAWWNRFFFLIIILDVIIIKSHCSPSPTLPPFSLIQWFTASGHHNGLNSASMSVTDTTLTCFLFYFIICWESVSWWTLLHSSGVIIFRWVDIILSIFLFYFFYEEVCSTWSVTFKDAITRTVQALFRWTLVFQFLCLFIASNSCGYGHIFGISTLPSCQLDCLPSSLLTS